MLSAFCGLFARCTGLCFGTPSTPISTWNDPSKSLPWSNDLHQMSTVWRDKGYAPKGTGGRIFYKIFNSYTSSKLTLPTLPHYPTIGSLVQTSSLSASYPMDAVSNPSVNIFFFVKFSNFCFFCILANSSITYSKKIPWHTQ